MGIIPLEADQFNKLVEIKFKNIIEGFDRFQNKIIFANNFEEKFIKFLKESYRLNNNQIIVEFCFTSLDKNSSLKIKEFLNDDEKEKFEKILEYRLYNTNYFKILKEEELDLFIKLSTRELFFVTYYFYNIPLTIWGNYNNRFPMFYKSENEFDKYKPLINKYSLEFE